MRTKEVTRNFALPRLTMAQKHNIRIPYRKIELKTIMMPNGTTTFQNNGVFIGELTERLVIALVGDSPNEWGICPEAVSFLSLLIIVSCIESSGKQIPRIASEPNFTKNDYIREYFALFEGLGLHIGNKPINLIREHWVSDYSICIFRLATVGLPSVPKSGNVVIELKFRVGSVH